MRRCWIKLGIPLVLLSLVIAWNYVRIYEPYYTLETDLDRARTWLERYHFEHGQYPTRKTLSACLDYEEFAARLERFSGIVRDFLPHADYKSEADLLYASNGQGYVLLQNSSEASLALAQKVNREIILNAARRWLGHRSSLGPTQGLTTLQKKFTDLRLINSAIERYKNTYGTYPISTTFAGTTSRYGEHSHNYIPGLAPEFIPALPCAIKDPADGFDYDYLYKSDERDYALIIHDRDFCNSVKSAEDDFYDKSGECRYAGFSTPGAQQWQPAMTDRRLYDLGMIVAALNRYKEDHGAYPVSKGLDGLYSSYGYAGPDWIKGLAPDYIAQLPRDPRYNDDPSNQYLYASNGLDYKIIAHHGEDLDFIREHRPDMLDPGRAGSAYGYWTPGAAGW